jgi:hypothetical protein
MCVLLALPILIHSVFRTACVVDLAMPYIGMLCWLTQKICVCVTTLILFEDQSCPWRMTLKTIWTLIVSYYITHDKPIVKFHQSEDEHHAPQYAPQHIPLSMPGISQSYVTSDSQHDLEHYFSGQCRLI